MNPNDHIVNNTRKLMPIVPNNFIECEKCNLSFLFMSPERDIHEENCVGPKNLWSKYFMNKGCVYLKTKHTINNDEINIPSPLAMTKEVTQAMTYVTSFLGFEPINHAKPVSNTNQELPSRPITPTKPVLMIDPNIRMIPINLTDLVKQMKTPVSLPRPGLSTPMKKTVKSPNEIIGYEKWNSLLKVASSALHSF